MTDFSKLAPIEITLSNIFDRYAKLHESFVLDQEQRDRFIAQMDHEERHMKLVADYAIDIARSEGEDAFMAYVTARTYLLGRFELAKQGLNPNVSETDNFNSGEYSARIIERSRVDLHVGFSDEEIDDLITVARSFDSPTIEEELSPTAQWLLRILQDADRIAKTRHYLENVFPERWETERCTKVLDCVINAYNKGELADCKQLSAKLKDIGREASPIEELMYYMTYMYIINTQKGQELFNKLHEKAWELIETHAPSVIA
ncbi:MAG: hypothetical protein GY793_08675 [Proteobacteria bacterium]|nr:hypothetical protein [Pseudomonadota bacterium]